MEFMSKENQDTQAMFISTQFIYTVPQRLEACRVMLYTVPIMIPEPSKIIYSTMPVLTKAVQETTIVFIIVQNLMQHTIITTCMLRESAES